MKRVIDITERENYDLWKNTVRDEELLLDLVSTENDDKGIFDRFYKDLEFGTAGLRGKLGAGTNRMNIYTVRRATQGLANYLLSKKEEPLVAIAYDTRHNSELFAKEAACVFAANGIKVWLYENPAPTPMLSYAVRERGCDSGVVVTASHNPKDYNGYKVYGPDGCQISPETAEEITNEILKIDSLKGFLTTGFDEALLSKKIQYLPDSFWRRYYARVLKESVDRESHCQNDLLILYTPLNGTGYIPVTTTLSLGSFGNYEVMREQMLPDSDFTTCPFPNPELLETMEFPIKRAKEIGADIVIATDPDCDRLGIAAKEKDGNFRLFSGNEVGAIFMDLIIRARNEHNNMPEKPIAISSLVSSPLADEIAEKNGVTMKKVFTGFRYIGKEIKELEEQNRESDFIFGYEESCGYMSGSYVRDKDGVNGALLACEAANYWKLRGKTLSEALDDIQNTYGTWADKTSNYYFEGPEGAEKIKNMMKSLRENNPEIIGNIPVKSYTDYLPENNVLGIVLEDESKIFVRPSGTEPKIKTYTFVKGTDKKSADEKLQKLVHAIAETLGVL